MHGKVSCCHVQDYGEQSYWEERYAASAAPFDWYHPYSALKPLLDLCCSRLDPCLQIGVGLSRLQVRHRICSKLSGTCSGQIPCLTSSAGAKHERRMIRPACLQIDMALDGYKDVLSIDYAPSCIAALRLDTSGPTACRYQLTDCRSMPELLDASFAAVIDKGTLDSVISCARGRQDAEAMVSEVARVLRPGGTYLLVSFGAPNERVRLLRDCGADWDVSAWYMVKPSAKELAERVDGGATFSVIIHGPISAQAELDALDMHEDVIFVYECCKAAQ